MAHKVLALAEVLVLIVLAACLEVPTALPTQTATPEKVPTLSPTAAVSSTATRKPARVTAVQSLNVRSRPGTDQPVIGALYTDQAVTITGNCRGAWVEIVYKNLTGWVNGRYLSDGCKE